MNRKSVLWGVAGGVALILAKLAYRSFWAPPEPVEIGSLPPPSAYVSTPQRDALLNRYLADVLAFSTLHETGHMLISVNHMPKPEHEEDEVDRFAVMVLSKNRSQMDHDPLLSAAEFWNAMQILRGNEHHDPKDPHREPQARADDIVCLMYGADPKRYAELAENLRMSKARLSECVDKARENSSRWGGVLASNLNSEIFYNMGIQKPGIAVLYNSVPDGLSDALAAALSHSRTLIMNEHVLDIIAGQLVQLRLPYKTIGRFQMPTPSRHPGVNHPKPGADLGEYEYVVRGDACLDETGNPEINASWDSSNHTITLCYALVKVMENTGKSIIAGAASEGYVH